MAESKSTVDDILGVDAQSADIVVGPVSNLAVTGDGSDNRLEGSAAAETLDGAGGNDNLFGFAGDDVMSGGTGDDFLFGGGGEDELNGNDGDDRITGGGGNDTVNGGAGFDTLVVFGNRADYSIDIAAGTITDLVGPEGTDTLTGVEAIQFADSRALVVPVGSSINDAIAEASDGDVILLGDGTYREQVSIIGRTGLTIEGTGSTVIESPDSLLGFVVPSPFGGTPAGPVAGNRDAGGVIEIVSSSNITVSGLAVDGRGLGSAAVTPTGNPVDYTANFVGILMRDSSGVVDDVEVYGVRDPLVGGTISGNQSGDAIAVYNFDGIPRSVDVVNSTITDFQKTGARFYGDGLTVLFDNNTVEGAGLLTSPTAITQNGSTIEAGATGRYADNTISEIGTLRGDFAGANILAVDPGNGLRFFRNTLSGVDDGAGGFEDTSQTGILIRGSANDTGVFQNTFEGLLNGMAGIQDVDQTIFGGNTFRGMIDSFTPITGGGTRPGLNIAVSGAENERPLDISTSDGRDLLQGTAFDDRIFAKIGNDFAQGLGGDDLLDGNEGNDSIFGDDGTDTLIGRKGNDVLEGGTGDDTLLGGGGNDQVNSQDGDDYANGGGGDDVVNGAAGDDEIFGNDGDDRLNGGIGSDRLDGGSGDDVLAGQGGIDTFIFNAADAGSDRVVGFVDGETVELNGFGFANVAAAEAAFAQVGTDVVFSAGAVTVRFEGTNVADVTDNIVLDAGSSSEGLERAAEPVATDAPETLVVLDETDWVDIA